MSNYLQIQSNKVFNLFPEYTLEQAVKPEKNTDNSQTTNILKQNVQSDTFKPEKNNKPKSKGKKILFGSTIASAIFTTGFVSLMLLKGFHGGSFNKLSKISEKLSHDIQSQNNTTKDLITKTAYYTRKGIKKSTETLQATSNFTAIKDWICDKIFKTNRVTTKFADKSTSVFKRVVDKTLGKKYDKVGVKIKDLTSLLKHYNIENLNNLNQKDLMQKITIKGQTKTLTEWINILSSQNQRLECEFDKSFSLGARRLRDRKRISLLEDLPQKIKERFFKNKNSLFNPKNYKTYATQDLTQEAQKELRTEITTAKKQISNNIASIHDTIKNSLNAYSKEIKPEDEASKQIEKLLRQQIEKFKNISGENEATIRQNLSDEISETIKNLASTVTSSNLYSQTEKQGMLKYLSLIKKSVLSTESKKKGSLEEIMTILHGLNKAKIKSTGQKIISDKQYKEFLSLSSNISKGLEKATDMEINEYFIKQAEMKVGSAPTDVLSVLLPIGVGAYSIGKSDGKDEKISATLTTCIPLVGTFATMVYGTTKMFSGVKNLAFSAISGLVLKLIGNGFNELYQKYKKTGSVATIVKDEYDKFLTDFEDKNTTKI